MANTSQQALTRQKIQTIVRSLGVISSSRVKIGLNDLNPQTEFYGDLTSGGPFYLILPAFNRNRDIHSRSYDLVVPCKLYFGAPNNQDVDSAEIEDIWSAIEDSVCDFNQYIGVNWTGAPAPKNGETVWQGFFPNLDPLVGLYTQEFVFCGTSAT